MSTIDIRMATPGDLAELVEIERDSFNGDQLSRRSLKRLLNRPSCSIWVAEDHHTLAAYALILYRSNSLGARLYSIAVAAPWRGRGVSRRLLAASESDAQRRGRQWMQLEVRGDNLAARALYEKAGYRPVKELLAYYADGGDGLRLRKWLGDARSGPDQA